MGIVTSANAAALRDILNVLRRRNPLLSVLIAPTLVQGDQAPEQIVRALQWLDGRDDIDTILIARGGGSIEDLWAFNDERVARAVFAARHPIISGVGHETDFTIVDFVADLRAPTPSAAAELAAPDISEIPAYLEQARQRLTAATVGMLDAQRDMLSARRQWLRLLSPRRRVDSERQHIDVLSERLSRVTQRRLDQWRAKLDIAQKGLVSANPLAILERGYSIVRLEDGRIVNRVAQAAPGARLTIRSVTAPLTRPLMMMPSTTFARLV
ncbi:MAG: exodeoxyribonuclease VII large subunit [Chloroflexota bacterium]